MTFARPYSPKVLECGPDPSGPLWLLHAVSVTFPAVGERQRAKPPRDRRQQRRPYQPGKRSAALGKAGPNGLQANGLPHRPHDESRLAELSLTPGFSPVQTQSSAMETVSNGFPHARARKHEKPLKRAFSAPASRVTGLKPLSLPTSPSHFYQILFFPHSSRDRPQRSASPRAAANGVGHTSPATPWVKRHFVIAGQRPAS